MIDPTNSNVIYAGLWNTRRPPWYTYRPSNGPGGGIFKSTDGGNTWKQLTNGPAEVGHRQDGHRGGAGNPRRVYAVVDCLEPDTDGAAGAGAAGGRRRCGGAAARQPVQSGVLPLR